MSTRKRTRLGSAAAVVGIVLGGCAASLQADAAASEVQAANAPPPAHTVPAPEEAAPMDEYGFLPPGDGREETVRICSGCHGLDLIEHQRLNRQEWFEMVQFMVDRGAMGTPAELAQITDYLAEHFPEG